MTYGSLFSGIGGIDLGLDRAGMKCLWQCEIDTYARNVLAKHWPKVTRYEDITKVRWEEADKPDVICGGFPCQDISVAGNGSGLSGSRSGLWFEYARCISHIRPRYVIVENVAALLVRGMDAVLGTLSSFGYDAEWSTVSACSLGAPHARERMFIVAYSDEIRRGRIRHCLQQQNDFSSRLNAWETSPGWAWRDVEQWACKIMETGNGIAPPSERRGMVDGVPNRLDRIGALGNAVVPQIAEFIGRAIMEE